MPHKRAKDRPVIDTVKWKGIPISLEYTKGQIRHDRELPMHYGFFSGSSIDDDGDHVDVFLGEDPFKNDVAFIINQNKPSGLFDEHKVIIGPSNAQLAKEAYLECYPRTFTGFGSIVAVTPYQLQWWLDSGEPTEAVDAEDFLPGGRAIKRASEFTPDYTISDLTNFGLTSPMHKTGWIEWYEGFTSGVRGDEDDARIAEWKRVVKKNANLLSLVPSTEAMAALVRVGVDPFPLIPRQHRKLANDKLAQHWRKYAEDRKPIIAIDLDGTYCENLKPFNPDKIGPVRKDMILLGNGLKALGCTIVIWTIRGNHYQVENHLRSAGAQFDYVNDSPFRPEGGSNKIYADVYLDDKAVRAEGPVSAQLRRILDILRTEGRLK